MPTMRLRLTPNLFLDEFDCHDGSPVPDKYLANVRRLAVNLQALRSFYGRPLVVISGYRSPAWNLKVKGEDQSQHLVAAAADIVVAGVAPLAVADTIEKLIRDGKMEEGGLGRYPHGTWVHYDVRGHRARWIG